MSRKKIVFLILLACISFFIALFVIDLFLWDVRLRKEADISNSKSNGKNPIASLTYDSSNGFFYSTTREGRTNNHGIVFSFNPATNALVKVADISNPNSDGKEPWASLTYDSSNDLFYGTTTEGGTYDYGTIFSFNPTTNALVKVANIYNFNSNGTRPNAGLTYNSTNGLFYGVTETGGNDDKGTIFSFNPTTNDLVMVADISNYKSNGTYSEDSLIYNSSNGLFYGTTSGSGTNNKGTVFSFAPR